MNILNIKDSRDYFSKEKINVQTLDNYFVTNNLSEIHILKIDTEGFDFILKFLDKTSFKK